MLALGVLFVVMGSTLSADPTRCCVDREFEAYLDDAGSYFTPQDREFHPIRGYTTLAYDFYNKRMNLRVHNTLENGTVVNSNIIFDYLNKIEYAIYKGKCTAFKLPYPMREPCIPANATFDGSLTMGYGPETLKLNTWTYTQPGRGAQGAVIKLAVSEEGCVPVVESIYMKQSSGQQYDVIYIISNFKAGIKNRKRLEVPDSCNGVIPKESTIIG